MASHGPAADDRRPTSPVDDNSPQYPGPSDRPGPPSIISSRMTDIASEDGEDNDHNRGSPSKGAAPSNGPSRSNTVRSAHSTARSPPKRSYVAGLAAQRGSLGASSISGSIAARPQSSSTSRSHVPTLTSHAFFHPMSSQKLQAQRGGSRPAPLSRHHVSLDDVAAEASASRARGSAQSSALGAYQRQFSDDGEPRPPASRGTEMTELETLDRITANTSPTHGHHPQGSLSESVRPLQKKNNNLHLNVDKSYKERTNLPSPIKSPRSFRSSFLLPKTDAQAQNGSSRNMQGVEKLSSAASSPGLAPHNASGADKLKGEKHVKPSAGLVFEYFEGNTVFCLGGRFQNTKHRPVNVATGLLVVLPSVLFFVFSAPWLWFNISPAIPIVFAYIFYICISSFVHASVSDPGILPRNLHSFPPEEDDDPLRVGPPTNDWTLVKSAESATAAMEVPVKHCRTCNIWRPPRAHHCRLCDNCIENHDHHCVWLNNCIGKRNYRYFFAFVTSTTLLSFYLLGACLAQILVYQNRSNLSFGQAINDFRVPFAMVIYGFLGALYPGALMGYHVFLMARGETTREHINSHKFVKKERFRAFTQGSMLKNWLVVLCRPRPPTYYRFKSKYETGDQRLGKIRGRLSPPKDSQDLEMQAVKSKRSFQGPVSLRNEAAAESR